MPKIRQHSSMHRLSYSHSNRSQWTLFDWLGSRSILYFWFFVYYSNCSLGNSRYHNQRISSFACWQRWQKACYQVLRSFCKSWLCLGQHPWDSKAVSVAIPKISRPEIVWLSSAPLDLATKFLPWQRRCRWWWVLRALDIPWYHQWSSSPDSRWTESHIQKPMFD